MPDQSVTRATSAILQAMAILDCYMGSMDDAKGRYVLMAAKDKAEEAYAIVQALPEVSAR